MPLSFPFAFWRVSYSVFPLSIFPSFFLFFLFCFVYICILSEFFLATQSASFPLSGAFRASRIAHVFQFFSRLSFSLSPSYSFALVSSSHFSQTIPAFHLLSVAATLNWIFPVSFTSYCSRWHSTYKCQQSRDFSVELTSHDSATLFALFSRQSEFLRFVRVDFLSDSHFAFHSPCIKVSS